MESTLVTCPQCGNKFSVEAALQHDIKEELRKEFETKAEKQSEELRKRLEELESSRKQLEKQKEDQDAIVKVELNTKLKEAENKIRKEASEEMSAKMELLEKENKNKAEQLKELRTKEAEFEQKERTFNEKMQSAELEMKKKLLEKEDELRKEAEKKANEKAELAFLEKESGLKKRQEDLSLEADRKAAEMVEKIRNEESLKHAELQKKLDDQKKLVDEMKRKSEQGSMQLQGEVQELAIEEYLKDAYPVDIIENIKTGARGADVIQTVMSFTGNACGKIYYESKRTKDYQATWLPKFKEDMRARSADIGILVTEILPKGMNRFSQVDGIWICNFSEFKAISLLMRETLMRIHEKAVAQENKGDKMVMLYDYLSSNEFRAHVEAIVEGFTSMRENLEKEKKSMLKSWKEREKQIDKVIENTVGMYGSIKGIAGGAVKEIKQLEMICNEQDIPDLEQPLD